MMIENIHIVESHSIKALIKACNQILAAAPVAVWSLPPVSYTHLFGGFKVQGKGEEAAQKLLDEARAVEEAGAFAVVLLSLIHI